MDPHGNIYMDDPDKVPPEDKARLEGFLRGRAEADREEHAALVAEKEKLRRRAEERRRP